MYVCMFVLTYVLMTFVRIYVRPCVRMYLCVYLCMYVCVHVCMHPYMYEWMCYPMCVCMFSACTRIAGAKGNKMRMVKLSVKVWQFFNFTRYWSHAFRFVTVEWYTEMCLTVNRHPFVLTVVCNKLFFVSTRIATFLSGTYYILFHVHITLCYILENCSYKFSKFTILLCCIILARST